MRRLRNSRKFRLYKEARRELCALYPAAFPPVGKRPALKIGILDDIRANGGMTISMTCCRRFLSIWTSSTAYLSNMRSGMPRIGLDGTVLDAVSDSHQREARQILSERKKFKRG
jgi:sRNA-binding protein|nr:ProQ/FinO family protein [Neorhizobium tomejilense]